MKQHHPHKENRDGEPNKPVKRTGCSDEAYADIVRARQPGDNARQG